MSDQMSTYQQLAQRFAAEDHKTRRLGGTEITYVTGEMVTSRLNEVLGFDGWSFEVKDVKVLDNEVWALGRMTVYSGERTIVREQAGGQIINRNRQGEIIELANDVKGAVTDTLKKCATLLGVGSYLYDEQERREVQAEMRDAGRPKPAPKPQPSPTPINDAVRNAAVLTGANPAPAEATAAEDVMTCVECKQSVATDAVVDIQRNPAGMRRRVKLADFAPVCIERLGAFHCGPCYDKKHWKKGA